jgi:hypothetical protein
MKFLATLCIMIFLNVCTAQSCGLHDASLIKKLAVNFDYPEGLHVEGAVWEAQQAGRLPMPDMERLQANGEKREMLNELAFRKTIAGLERFGELLISGRSNLAQSTVSVLLVDEMMWSRIVFGQFKVDLLPDTAGPEHDDLVFITETSVVLAIADTSMSLQESIKMGLIRLYGAPNDVQSFLFQVGLSDSIRVNN